MIGNERRFLVSRHVIRYLNEQQTVESLPILLGQVKLRNEPTGIAFWQPRQSNEPPHGQHNDPSAVLTHINWPQSYLPSRTPMGARAMHRIFQNYVDHLAAAQDSEALGKAMADAASALDMTCFAYLSIPHQADASPQLISNYASEWKEHYLERHYERFDPVIIRAFDQLEPFEWGLGIKLMSPSKLQQELFEEAARFGIRHAASSCFSATTSRASEAGTPMMNATSSVV
jgi:Autoinducer binding domain